MLRYAIYAGNSDTRETLALGLESYPDLMLIRAFDHFPETEELVDYVRAHSPQVLFFDISEGIDPLLNAASLARELGPTHLVAVDRNLDPEVLLVLMNVGVREFLRFPFEPEKVQATIDRVSAAIAAAPAERHSSELMFSFLPAKPGVGTSMTALHAAIELAARPHSKVLYLDFDQNCGVSRFLLKLGNPYCLKDVVTKATELDDGLWTEMISHYEELDILPGGLPAPQVALEPARIRSVFEFARRRYRVLLTDHSGALEAHSVDILRQSRRILLVVEQDLAAVHMAREKMRFLESEELQDRVALVVNRWRKDAPLTIADLESVLGVPAEATISDAPDQIYKSVMRGGALDPASTYFRDISGLATWLVSDDAVRKATPAKRKIEFFSIMPSRYSLTRA